MPTYRPASWRIPHLRWVVIVILSMSPFSLGYRRLTSTCTYTHHGNSFLFLDVIMTTTTTLSVTVMSIEAPALVRHHYHVFSSTTAHPSPSLCLFKRPRLPITPAMSFWAQPLVHRPSWVYLSASTCLSPPLCLFEHNRLCITLTISIWAQPFACYPTMSICERFLEGWEIVMTTMKVWQTMYRLARVDRGIYACNSPQLLCADNELRCSTDNREVIYEITE